MNNWKGKFKQYSFKDPTVIIKKVMEILRVLVEVAIKLIIIIHLWPIIRLWDLRLPKDRPNTTILPNIQIIL